MALGGGGGRIFKVGIEIGGKIGGSLTRSIREAQSKVSGLGKTVNRAMVDARAAGKRAFGDVLSAPWYQMGAAAGAALGAATYGLAQVGKEFDKAFDAIRVGTGATGKALEGLRDDFRAVLASVPEGPEAVGTVLADLNTRTGLTGQALQRLTQQTLDMARIAGTDAAQQVEWSTRLMGDWGVAAGDAGEKLDRLFRVSQATGPSMSRIGELMVQYGAPLRQLGLGFEESAAMMGKFEKEGVNTELVLGGLKKGLGAVGGDARRFWDVVERIRNTTDPTEAFRISSKVFGVRSAIDMQKAIQEGRFEFEELAKAAAAGGDTISGLAAETMDWPEKLGRLGNQFKIAIEPLAGGVFSALSEALDRLNPILMPILKGIGDLARRFPMVSTGVILVTGGLLGLLAIAPGIAAIVSVVTTLGGALAAAGGAGAVLGGVFAALTGPIGLTVLAIVGIGAALMMTYRKVGWFRDAVNGAWNGIRAGAAALWAGLRAIWDGGLGQMLGAVGQALGGVVKIVRGVLDLVVGIFTLDAARAVKGVEKVFGGFRAIFAAAGNYWKGLGKLAGTVFSGIVSFARYSLETIGKGIRDAITGWIRLIWELPGKLLGVGRAVADAILGGIRGKSVGASLPQASSRRSVPSAAGRRLPRREYGGRTVPGTLYVVGEKRPEVFEPDVPGRIIPSLDRAEKLYGAAGPTVTAAAVQMIAGASATPSPAAVQMVAPPAAAPSAGRQLSVTIAPGAIQVSVPGGNPDEVEAAVARALDRFRWDLESTYRSLLSD